MLNQKTDRVWALVLIATIVLIASVVLGRLRRAANACRHAATHGIDSDRHAPVCGCTA